MTISIRIRSQLFVNSAAAEASAKTPSSAAAPDASNDAETMLIRLPLNRPLPGSTRKRKSRAKKHLQEENPRGLGWSDDEHERFLRGLETFPTGPWKEIAAFVGTRTTRQVMTHAQKYRQKIARRQRGLQIPVRKPTPAAASSVNDELVRATTTTTSITSGEPAQMQTATEKAPISVEITPPSTLELRGGFSTLSTSSPSSTDHAMSDFGFYASIATESSGRRIPSVAMSVDEFQLATDELYAEALWANQFYASHSDERVPALLMYDVEDPLALMFQDPQSFGWGQQNKASMSMDVAYPAPLWTAPASAAGASYECQL